MTKGIFLITIGIIGIFFNTLVLIAYNIKMRKENEMAFITLRGLREPKTAKLIARKTVIMDVTKSKSEVVKIERKDVFDKKDPRFTNTNDEDYDVDDTVLL